ncbi:competence type IV pilus minor pilin ComGF [Paucisalibacillus sp. EB02]|uniref:competence type IV pilus minor pilin ComGF n=1 Tax=Paucisalibacillus sp. EB02 TaxID=1347087 RepID=UPI0004BAE1FF|nr:competence type IV pilus minor pilin ComGF [Paucisalibacillus sp. EB02]
MDYQKNEQGFTFYTLLFALTILIMCIPLYGAILKTLKENSSYNEISIQQVFHFIQQDVIKAINYRAESGKIYLNLYNGETVTIEQYGNLIRRQVDGQGHEIYLRNIQDFQVQTLEYGFNVYITSSEGEQYEKTITFYP